MGTTSFTLGPHFLRAGLRELEERKKRLDALRAHLDEGLEDIRCGRVVDDDEIDIARHCAIVERAEARIASELKG
jgi:Arc/MetJ-type ribon-helix-helix transcriptional regulator